MKSLSHVRLSATPWAVAHQAPPSMGFSRQEYWSGVPFPSLLLYVNTDLNTWQIHQCFESSQQPSELGTMIIPILHEGKRRERWRKLPEITQLVSGSPMNPDSPVPESGLWNFMIYGLLQNIRKRRWERSPRGGSGTLLPLLTIGSDGTGK